MVRPRRAGDRLHTRAPADHGVLLERAGFRSPYSDHVRRGGQVRVERAISDDLDGPGRTVTRQRRREVRMKVAAMVLAAVLAAAGAGMPLAAAAQDPPGEVALAAAGQIGRASCRERVEVRVG